MPTRTEPRVHIVDDDAAVRDSLRELIQSAGLSVELYASAEEFLLACGTRLAGCLLLDLRMAGMGGLDLQQALRARGADLPVIILTGHGDVPAATRAFKQGASEFIQKPYEPHELLRCVRAALAQHAQTRQTADHRSAIAARLEKLSSREHQVLELLTKGLFHKQIAAALGIAERTVEFHRAHVLQKMEAGSLAQLVQIVSALHGPDATSHFLSDPTGSRS